MHVYHDSQSDCTPDIYWSLTMYFLSTDILEYTLTGLRQVFLLSRKQVKCKYWCVYNIINYFDLFVLLTWV